MCAPDSVRTSSTTTASKSATSLAEQTISMSAGQLLATLAAVALAVFVATAHFYGNGVFAPYVGVTDLSQSSDARTMVPMDVVPLNRRQASPNQTSRTLVMKPSSRGGNSRSQAPAVVLTSDNDNSKGVLKVGNVASEVGLVIALQAIFPVVNRVILVAKRIKWAALGVRVSPAVGRFLKTFGNIWHTLMLAYKKTALSKIVTRTKKMVKVLKHADDHHDDHQDEHEHYRAHQKKHGHGAKYGHH